MKAKILIPIIVFILMIGIVNALTLNDGLISYYKLDNNNLSDSLSRSNLTNGVGVNCNVGSIKPSSNISGIINSARYFYVCEGIYGNKTLDGLSSNSTINLWLYKNGTSSNTYLYANDNAFTSWLITNVPQISINYNAVGTKTIFTMVDSNNNCSVSITNYTMSTDTWYMMSIVRNITHINIYRNASLISSSPCQNTTQFTYSGINQTMMIGYLTTSTRTDEIAIYNRSLSQSELNLMYNNHSGLQYPFGCQENWLNYNTTCNGFNYTILYNDTNMCNTSNYLPINNGTIVNCTICNPIWVTNDTICNGYNYTIQYYDLNNCNSSSELPMDNGTIVNCTTSCNWTLSPQPCLNNVRLIFYTSNVSNCTETIPNNNGTYVDCSNIVYTQVQRPEYFIPFLFLFVALVLCTVLGFWRPVVFYIGALLCGMFFALCIYYRLDIVAILISLFMVPVYVVIALAFSKMKN